MRKFQLVKIILMIYVLLHVTVFVLKYSCMGNKKSKIAVSNNPVDEALECFRPFGSVVGPTAMSNDKHTHVRELFMRIGTRSAQINAYYEHIHETRNVLPSVTNDCKALNLSNKPGVAVFSKVNKKSSDSIEKPNSEAIYDVPSVKPRTISPTTSSDYMVMNRKN